MHPCKHLTGAKCIVSHLGVTHILIGRKTNGSTVSLESNHGVLLHKSVKIWGDSLLYGVSLAVSSDSHTIHNDGQHRTLYACEFVELFQFLTHFFIYPFFALSRT